MAVVPPGYFGDYFAQYGQMNDSRNWNTKSYDYAVVKNKGEVSEEAKNENNNALAAGDSETVFGKGLFVKANKFTYVNSQGAMIEDKENPIYQIRDNKGKADNSYYVDQKTGDVYFRPTRVGINAISLPPTTTINSIDPQFFGTTFNLTRVPNPEEFGIGQLNNLNLLINGTGQHYGELIVNGVPIEVGNLNTNGILAYPPTAANAMYIYSNSFIAGTDNFSPLSGTWNYVPNGGAGYYESVGASQSTFSARTADNFVMKIKIRDSAGAGTGTEAGIQLRANRADDSTGTSGYYVRINAAGTIELYKAGINGPLPTVPAIIPANNGDLTIRMNGTQINVNGATFDDDDEVLYGKPFLDGYVSLRSESGTKRFDDFELISYPTAIQLLSKALKVGENSIVVKGYDTAAMNISLTGQIRDIRRGTPLNIDISTNNLPPDLRALNSNIDPSITSRMYREDSVSGADTFLDEDKAYWSVSQKSSLGIAGKIMFLNKEGGSIQKTKEQFSNVNNIMQNLTSLLGSQDDLFNSHLGIIK